MKKNPIVLSLILSFLLSFSAFSQETITITTYYPAPVGVYQQLVTQTLGVGDTNGDGVINGNDAPNPNDPADLDSVRIARNVAIGSDTEHNRVLSVRDHDGSVLLVAWTDSNGIQFRNAQGNVVAGIGKCEGSAASACDGGQNDFHIQTADGKRIWFQGLWGLAPHPDVTFMGNVGIGSPAIPQSRLDVAGGVKIGDTDTCDTGHGGTLRYHNNIIEYCNGTGWVSVSPLFAVGSGNVLNGLFIPFPTYSDGSTAQLSECEWIVAPNADICTNTGSDCSGAQETDHLICSANAVGGRIQVHAYTQEHGDPPIHPYQVRYLIVCRK